MCITIFYRGYEISVGLILNLLNELNKSILHFTFLCMGESNNILFKEFNNFSNEPARI